jgi:hypothetical protein
MYSGTSVYVRFGTSATWYASCLDAKNFVWYKSKDLERIKDVYRGTIVF